MIENNAFFEAVALFVFTFEEKGFEFGVIVIMDFEECLNWKEPKLEEKMRKCRDRHQ